jgi:hypothetical protein
MPIKTSRRRGPKHVKLLSEPAFNQAVSSHLRQINQAIETLYNEVNKLGVTAEDQATACDTSEEEDVSTTMTNCAYDIQEWAECVEETIDGIDTGSIIQKLRKMSNKKFSSRKKKS